MTEQLPRTAGPWKSTVLDQHRRPVYLKVGVATHDRKPLAVLQPGNTQGFLIMNEAALRQHITNCRNALMELTRGQAVPQHLRHHS